MEDMELKAKLEHMVSQGEAAFARIGEHAIANMPTMRDRFAMAALTGWLITLGTRAGEQGYTDHGACGEAARLAYETADAMLSAREAA